MKNLVCLSFCILLVNVSHGQTSNDLRVEKLPEMIEEAGSDKNYKLASKLEKELVIRKKIQKAIEVEAYNKAAELREDLTELEESLPIYITDTISGKVKVEILNKKDNLIYYMDLSAVGMNMYDYTYNQFNNSPQELGESLDMYSINFNMGHKYYFGPGNRNFRLGVDISYVTLNLGLDVTEDYISPSYALSGPSPGFVMTYYIDEDNGFDFQTNAGLMVVFSEISNASVSGLGVTVLPRIRYWHKKFGLGVEYNYFFSNINSLPGNGCINLNHLGLLVGLRF